MNPPHEDIKKKVSTRPAFGKPRAGHATTSWPMPASERNPKLEVKLHRKIVNHEVEFSFSIPVLPPPGSAGFTLSIRGAIRRRLSLTRSHQ